MPKSTIEEVAQALKDEWGVEFRKVQWLVCRIAAFEWVDINDLLPHCHLSYRSADQILRQLEPWLARGDDRVRSHSHETTHLLQAFGCTTLEDSSWEIRYPELLQTMETIVREVPRPKRRLDQVQATPKATLERARFLRAQFHLSTRNVLFLGDHDLTSVALALLETEAKIFVADVDDELLDYMAFLSVRHDLALQLRYSDFRLELPRSLGEHCDLVFLDPPYTPYGVEVFCKRALEALGHPRGRILVAYGHSERHPALGYKVQSVFHRLRFVIEAVLPHFSRYSGAPAIGGTADLYILRPTRRSRPAAEKAVPEMSIYSKGGRAIESTERKISESAEREVLDLMKSFEEKDYPVDLVGRWSKAAESVAVAHSWTDYLEDLYQRAGDAPSRSVAFNLYPDLGGYALRLPLICTAEWLLFVTPFRLADDHLARGRVRELIEVVYHVEEIRRVEKESIVIMHRNDQSASDRRTFVIRSMARMRQAKLANAWREALITWYRREKNVTITKNQARNAIARTPVGRLYSAGYLNELSSGALKRLSEDVDATLAELDEATEAVRQT